MKLADQDNPEACKLGKGRWTSGTAPVHGRIHGCRETQRRVVDWPD